MLLQKPVATPGTYAAWLTAAADAHRTGDPEAKAKADRLYTEMKFAAKRSARRHARMNRN